jgi:hypothetical protein
VTHLELLIIADALRMLAAALDDDRLDAVGSYQSGRLRELADQVEADGAAMNRNHADVDRVLRWYNEKPRKTATQAFTAGPERQAAYLIELAEREAVADVMPIAETLAEHAAERAALVEAAAATTEPDQRDWRERMCERLHGPDCRCGIELIEERAARATWDSIVLPPEPLPNCPCTIEPFEPKPDAPAIHPAVLYCAHPGYFTGMVCATCGLDVDGGPYLAPNLRAGMDFMPTEDRR